ncbi:MAG: NAD(P)/FAD-dependent oxidoreductase [Caulobacteraceae bacterium]
MSAPFDCVVVGGGAAGLTAALYLARFRRRAMVFDTGASRARWIPHSRNLPGFPEGLGGQDLLDRLAAQTNGYGVKIHKARVTQVERKDVGFVVRWGDEQWRARTVLVATGVVDTIPPLPGMAEAIQRGLVRVCPICDGYEARDRSIGVLGDGDHAAREALFLRTYSAATTLVLTPDGALSPERQQALAEAQIAVRRCALDRLDLNHDHAALHQDGLDGLRFDTLYAAFGVTPQVKLIRDLGLPLAEDGRIMTDAHQETAMPGLFAAGDVVRGLNQICVAEGEAAIAACAIHNRLKG